MKFEQLLQIYWSRGFLYGGRPSSFNTTLRDFFDETSSFSSYSKKKFIKRFELDFFFYKKDESFIELSLDQRKIFNMYFSQISSINNNILELIKYNIIRRYLIKTFRGRKNSLGKPSRGQRTRSNAQTAKVINRVIRLFITQVKKNNVIEKKKRIIE